MTWPMTGIQLGRGRGLLPALSKIFAKTVSDQCDQMYSKLNYKEPLTRLNNGYRQHKSPAEILNSATIQSLLH